MSSYKFFDDFFGKSICRRYAKCESSLLMCPICDSTEIDLGSVVDDGRGCARVVLTCCNGHEFALRVAREGEGVSGAWEVLTESSLELGSVPSLKQFQFSETISQNLGCDNEWSLAHCLFPESSGDDGLPLFMTCGVTKDSAMKWISGKREEFDERFPGAECPKAFIVWKAVEEDGRSRIGYSLPYKDLIGHTKVWTGPGLYKDGSGVFREWQGDCAFSWTRERSEVFAAKGGDCRPTLKGSPVVTAHLLGRWAGWSEILADERLLEGALHTYRLARKTAEACAVFELESGNEISNKIPVIHDNVLSSLLTWG